MKCWKNKALSLTLALALAVTAVFSAAALASCTNKISGGAKNESVTDSDNADDSGNSGNADSSGNANDSGGLSGGQTAPAEQFDFENAAVSDYVICNAGDTVSVAEIGESEAKTEASPAAKAEATPAAKAEATPAAKSEAKSEAKIPVFSHPAVAEMRDGKIFAKSAGVTLLGFEGEDTAIAVCVLKDGVSEEKSAGKPLLLEVGSTRFVEGFASPDGYTVSDGDVVSLDGITVTAENPGYAVVDASNASMPKLFAFLVFDRTVG